MPLALFDLDDTLIEGNCETDWFRFLIARGYYDGSTFDEDIAEFDRQYASGAGDINDYMYFVLKPLTQQPMDTLRAWRSDWFESRGKALIKARAPQQLQQHRDNGDTLVIISASNQFCVEPFADAFGVEHFLSSIPQKIDNRFSGVFEPPACFGADKIVHLNRWLAETDHSLEGSWFYSDSRNDLPLLELVDHPIAVNADDHLSQVASERDWICLDLR